MNPQSGLSPAWTQQNYIGARRLDFSEGRLWVWTQELFGSGMTPYDLLPPKVFHGLNGFDSDLSPLFAEKLATIIMIPVFKGNLEFLRIALRLAVSYRLAHLTLTPRPSLSAHFNVVLPYQALKHYSFMLDVQDCLSEPFPQYKERIDYLLHRCFLRFCEPEMEFIAGIRAVVWELQKPHSIDTTHEFIPDDVEAVIRAWDAYAVQNWFRGTLKMAEEYRDEFATSRIPDRIFQQRLRGTWIEKWNWVMAKRQEEHQEATKQTKKVTFR